MPKSPLSVAVVTLDEEKRLPRCLASLEFADEIVVVDSGSRDDTVAIARRAGCRTWFNAWENFSKQKQFAVDRCENDWVLILDADERIPPETASTIQAFLASEDDSVAACRFSRKNFFHGRWIRGCGWWPDKIVRLVDRRRGRFNDDPVHESWICRGAMEDLDAPIEHFSFQSYSDMARKMDRYSTMAARRLSSEGAAARWWTPFAHGGWMFLRSYIFSLGALDGFDGFMISLFNAQGSFMKYAKLREASLYGEKTFE